MTVVTWILVVFLLLMVLSCFILTLNANSDIEDRKMNLFIGVVCLVLMYVIANIGGLMTWRV